MCMNLVSQLCISACCWLSCCHQLKSTTGKRPFLSQHNYLIAHHAQDVELYFLFFRCFLIVTVLNETWIYITISHNEAELQMLSWNVLLLNIVGRLSNLSAVIKIKQMSMIFFYHVTRLCSVNIISFWKFYYISVETLYLPCPKLLLVSTVSNKTMLGPDPKCTEVNRNFSADFNGFGVMPMVWSDFLLKLSLRIVSSEVWFLGFPRAVEYSKQVFFTAPVWA